MKINKITIRLTDEQKNLFDVYRKENNISNASECIRQLILSRIQKDIDDKNLTLQSLSTLHDRVTKSLENEEVLLNLMLRTHQNILVYQTEIPEEAKEGAVKNGVRRFRKWMEAFKRGLRENPERFESLLADIIEDR